MMANLTAYPTSFPNDAVVGLFNLIVNGELLQNVPAACYYGWNLQGYLQGAFLPVLPQATTVAALSADERTQLKQLHDAIAGVAVRTNTEEASWVNIGTLLMLLKLILDLISNFFRAELANTQPQEG